MSHIDAYRSERASFLTGFAGNVRRFRAKRGLSQEQLSDISGLHRTEIGKIEQGAVEPRLMTLLILAHSLEVSLDDLVQGLGTPEERKPRPVRGG
jgi:transcriptional regulator with XRE-family HTH domain